MSILNLLLLAKVKTNRSQKFSNNSYYFFPDPQHPILQKYDNHGITYLAPDATKLRLLLAVGHRGLVLGLVNESAPLTHIPPGVGRKDDYFC
jgi:hypothetical protein